MANTVTVTDQNWDQEVLGSDRLVLVDFWAEWCGPCRKVAPLLEEIADQMGDKLTLAKLNVDENPNVTRTYRVLSIPTLTLFKDGDAVQSVVGVQPKGTIVRMIEAAL